VVQEELRTRYALGYHAEDGYRRLARRYSYGFGCWKLVCRVCGVEFFARRPEARYCCLEHAKQARKEMREARPAPPHRRMWREHKNCWQCRAPIPEEKRSDAHFCSDACRQKHYRRQHQDRVTAADSAQFVPKGLAVTQRERWAHDIARAAQWQTRDEAS
jgi:hypothetical protein